MLSTGWLKPEKFLWILGRVPWDVVPAWPATSHEPAVETVMPVTWVQPMSACAYVGSPSRWLSPSGVLKDTALT